MNLNTILSKLESGNFDTLMSDVAGIRDRLLFLADRYRGTALADHLLEIVGKPSTDDE